MTACRSMTYLLPLLAATWAGACTTLGPMPATTGVTATPSSRPGAEVQAAIVPIFYLSDAAHDGEPDNRTARQVSALIAPRAEGLVLGARQWGEAGDAPVEPMVGWRGRLTETVSLAGIGYGTMARGSQGEASYEALRLGGELVADARAIPLAGYLSLHVQGSLSATYLDADGIYCVGVTGIATDCDDGDRRVDGTIRGVYTAGTFGLALDARRPTGMFHHLRFAVVGAIGGMPRIRDGRQERSGDVFHSVGLSLTIGFGRGH